MVARHKWACLLRLQRILFWWTRLPYVNFEFTTLVLFVLCLLILKLIHHLLRKHYCSWWKMQIHRLPLDHQRAVRVLKILGRHFRRSLIQLHRQSLRRIIWSPAWHSTKVVDSLLEITIRIPYIHFGYWRFTIIQKLHILSLTLTISKPQCLKSSSISKWLNGTLLFLLAMLLEVICRRQLRLIIVHIHTLYSV